MTIKSRGQETIDRPFCPRPICLILGLLFGMTQVIVHGYQPNGEKRWKCKRCGHTFNRWTFTPLSGLRTNKDYVIKAIKAYVRGSSVSDIAYIFDVQDKTVENWIKRVTEHSRNLLTYLFDLHGQLDVTEIQLDELWTYKWGRKIKRWIWIALDPNTKLWIAFHIGSRTKKQAEIFLEKVKKRVKLPKLFTTDGLEAYKSVIRELFPNVPHGIVIKKWKSNHVVEVKRCLIGGHVLSRIMIHIKNLVKSRVINTSYVERFNLTLRRGLASLNRKTLEAAKTDKQLDGDLCVYQLYYAMIRPHMSLTVKEDGLVLRRTPAMAAGLSDHQWTWLDALTFVIPPVVTPKTQEG